jgi:hypothetical protein|tara:strand:+ start:582 stop:1001 length:420 start_codon:yes stop_codon:yes gene_type:complete
MTTLNVTNIKHASSSSNNIVLNSNGTITATNSVSTESVKVWARFDMDQGGTAIDDSYNVDSIVDGATGVWQVVFDTDFANANYAILVSAGGAGNHTASFHDGEGNASYVQETTDCWIAAWGYNWIYEDHEVSIACFGDQ